jgi:predicted PurR-regulated permease PerM
MILKFLKDKRLIATIVIIALLIFIIYAALPFISAIFGALILAYLLNPLNKRLKKRFSPSVSAWILLVITLIVIIIPLFFLVYGLIEQIRIIPGQLERIGGLEERINEVFPFDVNLTQSQIRTQTVNITSRLVTPIFSNIIQGGIILFLLFFLLYYFLVESDKLKKWIRDVIPFNEEHKQKLVSKFKDITNSTIIGTFLIALVQGGLLALNFFLLGIPNALFWGFVTVILSFLPIVGAPLVWGPAAFFLIITGNVPAGIAMIVIGMMISTIDNILRPIVNSRYGSIHPIISIVGIYIGISQFGLVGLFIGPLLIAYLLLIWQMYKEEYLR